MNIDYFLQKSGFKALALAPLSSCEYSIVLYLMNCAFSGLEQIIITEAELADVIGFTEKEVDGSIQSLSDKSMLRIKYGDTINGHQTKPSISIAFQYDISKWSQTVLKEMNLEDAIVYPFIRHHDRNLSIIPGHENENNSFKGYIKSDNHHQTWQRIVDSFAFGRDLSEDEIAQERASAKMLVEAHPVDQILLLLRHFQLRVPSLSLLASSWQHYQELYEAETQKVDFLDARRKHLEMDKDVKESAQKWLDNAHINKLSPDEINVLKLLIRHRHPRRQLFWAYQLRSRYQNLLNFFEENANKMLAVTTTGAIVKPPPHNHNK